MFPDGGSAFYKGGRAAHGAFGGGFVESDLRATEEELEQAVRREKPLADTWLTLRSRRCFVFFICLALETLVVNIS